MVKELRLEFLVASDAYSGARYTMNEIRLPVDHQI